MRERLGSLSAPIRIGIIGIGSIGKGLCYQASITPGFECVAIADIVLDKAIAVAEWLQLDYTIVHSADAVHDAIRQGKLAVTDNSLAIAGCDTLDLMIEASNTIAEAGEHAVTALRHETAVSMMNYEADVAFGPYLLALSRQHDTVYTGADGDQPAVIKTLIDDLKLWGFDLVMAGNIKGYLDRYADPTSIIPEAEKRNLDPKMCASYTDGTKLNIEMASLANAEGLHPATPGMLGPRVANVHDLFHCFDLHALWQEHGPVVDYLLGAKPSGGVYAIGYTANDFQQFTLSWFPPDMGPGPFYLFYRPYHLGHIEALKGAAEAVLDKRPRLQPVHGFVTNVYTYAKRDLRRGEMLDGIGGYACYGLIEDWDDDSVRAGLPIVLAENVTLTRDIAKDEKIYVNDVYYDPTSPAFTLFAKAKAASKEVIACISVLS